MALGDRIRDWREKRDARKLSFRETEEAFAQSQKKLSDLQDYDPQGLTEAQKETGRVGAAEQAGKLIAAQQAALAQPGGVGTPTAQSIKRAQAIAGEGAQAAAEGAAVTSAELEGLSEEIEQAEREWMSAEEQRLLSNIAAFREMKKQRIGDIFGMIGGATSNLVSPAQTPEGG